MGTFGQKHRNVHFLCCPSHTTLQDSGRKYLYVEGCDEKQGVTISQYLEARLDGMEGPLLPHGKAQVAKARTAKALLATHNSNPSSGT